MVSFNFIPDSEAQEEIVPGVYPMSTKDKFVSLLGREPETNSDAVLILMIDCEGCLVTREDIAELFGIHPSSAHYVIQYIRQLLKRADIRKVIHAESKIGWYFDEEKAARGLDFDAKTMNVVQQIRNAGGHMNGPAQIAIVAAYVEAGIRVQLTYGVHSPPSDLDLDLCSQSSRVNSRDPTDDARRCTGAST